MNLIFIPLKTFESPELKSVYVEGLQYTVHSDNARLAHFAAEWLALGLVRLEGEGSATAARVGGIGQVK